MVSSGPLDPPGHAKMDAPAIASDVGAGLSTFSPRTPMASILVADDDEGDRLRLTSILRRAGHDVREAATGAEALAAYATGPVDVVVTDLVMSGGDGLALIDGLLEIDPDAHVVAVSGKGREVLDFATVIGARCTLQKPVSPVDLLRAVEHER